MLNPLMRIITGGWWLFPVLSLSGLQVFAWISHLANPSASRTRCFQRSTTQPHLSPTASAPHSAPNSEYLWLHRSASELRNSWQWGQEWSAECILGFPCRWGSPVCGRGTFLEPLQFLGSPSKIDYASAIGYVLGMKKSSFSLRNCLSSGQVSPITFFVCSVTIIGIPKILAARMAMEEASITPWWPYTLGTNFYWMSQTKRRLVSLQSLSGFINQSANLKCIL